MSRNCICRARATDLFDLCQAAVEVQRVVDAKSQRLINRVTLKHASVTSSVARGDRRAKLTLGQFRIAPVLKPAYWALVTNSPQQKRRSARGWHWITPARP